MSWRDWDAERALAERLAGLDQAEFTKMVRHYKGRGILDTCRPVVYFLDEQGPASPIKIGYSSSGISGAWSRKKAVQIGNPRLLRLRAVIFVDGALGCALAQSDPLETVLHWRFASDRTVGEWFRCTNELDKLIDLAAAVVPAGVRDRIKKLNARGERSSK